MQKNILGELSAAINNLAGTMTFIALNVGDILTLGTNAEAEKAFIAFSNWFDNVNFPEKYGSGWLMRCTDGRDSLIIYVTTALNAYVGKRHIEGGTTTITWKTIATS